MDSAGVTVDAIPLMSGGHHFNEVTFDDVLVSDEDVLGEIGNGWHQVTSELAYERSGPERLLSTLPLIRQLVRSLAASDPDDRVIAEVGDLVARVAALRLMSIGVAQALVGGADASSQAALVKDLGTRFEQSSVDVVADLADYVGDEPTNAALGTMLRQARLHAPLFTLRGGTNEVLRGVVAKKMGMR
jgi:acyl-CoA dehydrogenase